MNSMDKCYKEYDCGCEIATNGYGDYEIEYCPKHKAAPEMYEELEYFLELHQAFNNMLGLHAKDEDIVAMLDTEMDNLGTRIERVRAKARRRLSDEGS